MFLPKHFVYEQSSFLTTLNFKKATKKMFDKKSIAI